MVNLKRAYETPSREDGARILVERLWPRGLKKSDLKLDGWLKPVAPSSSLRQWFAHDPAKWQRFRQRYFKELEQHPEAVELLIEAARRGPVTLVFSARDTRYNNAVALRTYLLRRLRSRRKPPGR
jgi:uncharacterized protein YeaO (DUF488 family)